MTLARLVGAPKCSKNSSRNRNSGLGQRILRQRRARGRKMFFEMLEERAMLAFDIGDAPDMGIGTATGNYNTRFSDNGPRHDTFFATQIKMGSSVDSDLSD